jgi:NMD protein affecting ribosome stability and mRNA decay
MTAHKPLSSLRFCPKCGKKGIDEEFCKACSEEEGLKRTSLGFKDIVIKKCVDCSRFMVRHAWTEFDVFEEGIVAAALPKISNPEKLELSITLKVDELKNKPGLRQEIELEICAKECSFLIPAVIEFTYCPKCCKADSEYFEGNLQLRNATSEIIAFVKNDLAEQEKNGVHIAKEKIKGDSADFKLSSSKYLRALGKKIKARFNGELTETSRLFSRNKQTSKDIYRTTVLFRLRGHRVGDIITQRGREIKIKTIGKRVTGIDVKTGKKVFVE